MKKDSLIYVAGHNGLVGSAIVRELNKKGYTNILTRDRKDLDLQDSTAVKSFFESEKPEYVFLAAAKVGGIVANSEFPADFLYQNLVIQNNIIHNAYLSKVKKLLFLGSSCIYPKFAKQPIKEDSLLTGTLEETNDAYAIAKIAGIKMCQSYNKQYGTNFISAMPTNLYGPGDNFDLKTSHVIPAMIRKFDDAKSSSAKEVVLWGTGKPKREFLFVDDLAEALVFLMNTYNINEIINVGTGVDLTIKSLADLIKKIVSFEGKIIWDKTKPDGTPRKLLNVKKINKLGWEAKTDLGDGIRKVYLQYKSNK